ncbi:RNA methyltransferase [Candidatus Poribacteria bacterium]|nr:RNA methyltransferase [Candidatus Poribacteria bacterium]
MITSGSNPKIQHVRSLLAKRRCRDSAGEFVAHGAQAITEAVRAGWLVRQLLYYPDARRSPRAQALVEACDPNARVPVADHILRRLGDRGDTEIVAVIQQRRLELHHLAVRQDCLALTLDRPRNPGNLGAIIRSADALGASCGIIIEPAVDLFDPRTVRATMGSAFSLPMTATPDAQTWTGWIDQVRNTLTGLAVIGLDPGAARTLSSVDFTRPTVLVIGSEQDGIAEGVRTVIDEYASIPMSGSAESLNAAVAASIALYEVRRQRHLDDKT